MLVAICAPVMWRLVFGHAMSLPSTDCSCIDLANASVKPTEQTSMRTETYIVFRLELCSCSRKGSVLSLVGDSIRYIGIIFNRERLTTLLDFCV